eukprot:176974-Amorphochlora_amoeboformis.AAC.1
MAIGEWISMQLQNDGLEYELMSMRNFQTLNPIGAVKKLREVLGEKYGLSPKTLEAIVQDLKDSGMDFVPLIALISSDWLGSSWYFRSVSSAILR